MIKKNVVLLASLLMGATFANSASAADIDGEWDATWTWAGSGSRTSKWTIEQSDTFSSDILFFLSSTTDSYAVGATLGPQVFFRWIALFGGCRALYKGRESGGSMTGTMECTNGDPAYGTWSATRREATSLLPDSSGYTEDSPY